MLGMMPSKGGQTTLGNPMNSGSAASMTGKGGGTTNAPVLGAGGAGGGVPATPSGLAALFTSNRPTAPVTGSPAPLPRITQPQRPVVEQPPPRLTPVQPAAAQPAWTGPIRTRADLANYLQMFPERTDVRDNFNRGPGNYWGRNGGHGGSR
jgi:hypothetical protein